MSICVGSINVVKFGDTTFPDVYMDSCSSPTLRAARYPRPPNVCVQGSPGVVVLDHIRFAQPVYLYTYNVY